jgi:hypothetical protein
MIGNYPDPSYPPNAVIDWPEVEAKRMIALGLVNEAPQPDQPKDTQPAPAQTRKTKKG